LIRSRLTSPGEIRTKSAAIDLVTDTDRAAEFTGQIVESGADPLRRLRPASRVFLK